MNKEINYEGFESFVFRVPVLPLKPNDQGLMNSHIFKEALFLASRDLYDAFQRIQNGNFDDMSVKTNRSLLKYYIRMSSRCTPFGLFAGCGIGKIDNEKDSSSEIMLNDFTKYKSFTRIDTDYLVKLSQKLSSNQTISEKILFYPNNSLYKIGNYYRYVEAQYSDNKGKRYFLSEVPAIQYLRKILTAAKRGSLINDLINISLEDASVSNNEKKDYIYQLIENQVLISELEVTVTGIAMLDQLILRLEKANVENDILLLLKDTKEKLEYIDNRYIGRPIEIYRSIEANTNIIASGNKNKNLIQSDLLITAEYATINKEIIKDLKEAITLLNKLNPKVEDEPLNNFKMNFYRRYGEEEIPLVEALDTDIGIGYLHLLPENVDFNPLLSTLNFISKSDSSIMVKFSEVEQFILNKYIDWTKSGADDMIISDEEIKHFPEKWDDLPDTFSIMAEIINDINSKILISIKSCGGSSAANLLGRFCHIDPGIKKFVDEIIKKEEEIKGKGKILAEIIHLPESRVGNVLHRPHLRHYEIPYLSSSSVSNEFGIPVTDLMISVPNGKRVRLRSKYLNKEVIPRLTTAHNYYSSSLPIYLFLCCLQTEGLRSNLHFNWGRLLNEKEYLPRVRYKNIILSPAKWNIKADEIKDMCQIDSPFFFEKVKKFRDRKCIPNKVLLSKGDNKLLIDFNDISAAKVLMSEVKGNNFILEEFKFNSGKSIVRGPLGDYTNEFIFGFYKKEAPSSI